MLPSFISEIYVDGRKFYVKRDDLVDPFLAGNKFRKLHTLLQTPKEQYSQIISYGGIQSNAMLAIAAMCKKKSWNFTYYTKPVSPRIQEQKYGNYFLAKELGMHAIELEDTLYKDYIASLPVVLPQKSYLLAQGGADSLAKEGMIALAQEIRDSGIAIKSIALPSGTGTSALYLALHLPEYRVYTTACIGNTEYLKEQMQALESIPKNLIILEGKKKYHFAKLYDALYRIYKKLLQSEIEFDLLYAPLMWQCLLEQTQEEIMYIHTGGVSGNETMLVRYERKNLS